MTGAGAARPHSLRRPPHGGILAVFLTEPPTMPGLVPPRRLRPVASALAAALALAATACSSSSAPATGADAAPHDAATHDSHVAPGKDAAHDARSSAKPDAGTGADASDAVAPLGDAGGPSEAGKAPGRAGDASSANAPLTFAIHHLWLGDSDPDPSFTPDTSAWSTFGYNIDGLITTEYSTDVCTLDHAAHATTAVQVDGTNGIDNSFGKNIVPVLASALPMLSQTVSASIASGSFTILLGTTGLTSSPTQTNTGLTGSLFSGAPYAGTPPVTDAGSFLPTDSWPILSGSLSNGVLDAGALVDFPTAYVTNGVWVNGSPGDITLLITLQNQPLVLAIHQAVISFTHTVDSAGQSHASGGFISGVLRTSEFLVEINHVAAQQDYCTEASCSSTSSRRRPTSSTTGPT